MSLDLVNKKFGRLTVLKLVGKNGSGHYMWLCSCECGRTTTIQTSSLTSGLTKSCGCYQKESTIIRSTRHGQSTRKVVSPEYRAFKNARQRCSNSNDPRFQDWGGRGIKFCFETFEEFLSEVGVKPEPKNQYSLDRYPNNDGNYEKGNVRWATKSQQVRNQRCDNCQLLRRRIVELEEQLRKERQ